MPISTSDHNAAVHPDASQQTETAAQEQVAIDRRRRQQLSVAARQVEEAHRRMREAMQMAEGYSGCM